MLIFGLLIDGGGGGGGEARLQLLRLACSLTRSLQCSLCSFQVYLRICFHLESIYCTMWSLPLCPSSQCDFILVMELAASQLAFPPSLGYLGYPFTIKDVGTQRLRHPRNFDRLGPIRLSKGLGA